MTKAAAFRLSDVQRAIKAAAGSGLTVSGVEITKNGTIRVLTGAAAAAQGLSPFEAWEAANGVGPA